MPDSDGERLGLASTADPSPVTEARIVREIANLKENLGSRLAEMQRAVDLTQKFPTLLDQSKADLQGSLTAAIKAQDDLTTEKLCGVGIRFDTVREKFAALDKLIEQAAAASKEAVNAAFKAAGDASQIQAQGAKEAISSLNTLFGQSAESTSEKIGQLDRRLTIIEGRKEGGAATIGYIFSGIGAFLAIIGIVAAIVAFDGRSPAPQIIYQSPPPPVGQSSIVTPIVPQK